MSEDVVSSVHAKKNDAPGNGRAPAAASSAEPETPEVSAPNGSPPDPALPDELVAMFETLKKMTPEQKTAADTRIKKAMLKALQDEAAGLTEEPKSTTPKPIDPGAFDGKMIRVSPPLPELTLEAMEHTSYDYEGKKVYQPFDGLIDERIMRQNGQVFYVFKLSAPFVCQNCYGEFVEVPRGKQFICAASTSMRVQLDAAFEYQKAQGGHCHVRCRPLGYATNGVGEKQPVWDCRIEPMSTKQDAPDEEKARPKLFDREDQ